MEAMRARQLAHQFGNAVAYVDVLGRNGDVGIGSAFHVGDGVFVTARHVVEGKTIRELKVVKPVPVRAKEFLPGFPDETYRQWDAAITEMIGSTPYYKNFVKPFVVIEQPRFPGDAAIDLAVLRVQDIHLAVPYIPLPILPDDWVYQREWELSEVVLLGYPVIPMSRDVYLVAARAQVHTFVVPWHSPAIHFVLSGTPRGGFSGGPAITADGQLLGVITSALADGGQAVENGFFCAISVGVVREFLEHQGWLPGCQRK